MVTTSGVKFHFSSPNKGNPTSILTIHHDVSFTINQLHPVKHVCSLFLTSFMSFIINVRAPNKKYLQCNKLHNDLCLQIIVWGDYGRMDRKVFMGVVQILLDDLDLNNLCMGWYKLFSTSSMCDPPLPSSSPLGGSPKKSPGPSPRSSMAHAASPRMSPLPTIMPPPAHGPRSSDYDDPDGDYV